jgi:hypothetical protein
MRQYCFCLPRFQQLGIAPDMLIALIFGQVETVKVLGKLPKLGGQRIIFDFDAVDFIPTQPDGGGVAMGPRNQNGDASGQTSVNHHFFDHADGDGLAKANLRH